MCIVPTWQDTSLRLANNVVQHIKKHQINISTSFDFFNPSSNRFWSDEVVFRTILNFDVYTYQKNKLFISLARHVCIFQRMLQFTDIRGITQELLSSCLEITHARSHLGK